MRGLNIRKEIESSSPLSGHCFGFVQDSRIEDSAPTVHGGANGVDSMSGMALAGCEFSNSCRVCAALAKHTLV